MNKLIIAIGVIVIAGLLLFLLVTNKNAWVCENGEWVKKSVSLAAKPTQLCMVENKIQENAKISNMEIASDAFSQNGKIPKEYTCDGDNINPPLKFIDVPQDSKSVVLIVDDPDAPAGVWIHWTVWNISPEVRQISERSVPENAVEGVNSFGKVGYGGPCPPSGTHRYVFKLYALDTKLDLDKSTRAATLEEAMSGHIVDQAQLVGLYR